jgi:Cu/Ag efflux protein CusF
MILQPEENPMRYKGLSFCFASLALALFLGTTALAAEAVQGKVLSAGAGKLTIADLKSNMQQTHEVAANAQIMCEGKKCSLSDVKTGDLVLVTVDQNGNKAVVTKIEVKSADSAS